MQAMAKAADLDELRARKRFEPGAVEPALMREWLDSGLFHPAPEGDASENYSIAIPPPNITGALHMGHALNGAIQDALIRFHRMGGRRTRWIFGTDHASIATQRQVEKELLSLGTSREALGREGFLERTWSWRERYGATIVEQYKRLGASCDYADERFTMDSAYADAVTRVFVALFERGYIHRDHYMVNWDPGSGSAISDLEVEEREEVDTLYRIAYPLADGSGEIVVATVRPETMLADSAIAVRPGDERYAALVGSEAILPLVGRRLPVITDEYVKPDFGSGALKVTPGHDPNDFEIGRRHGLEQHSVIGEDGRMTAEAGEAFAGLTVAEARAAVVAALEREGALRGSEPYTHAVPYSHRSGERIEPLISLQWFMRMDELAQPAVDAVRDGRVRFHPERWAAVYLDWMENIRPWCVSRQLWWGHRLPVYYCDACAETYVAREPPQRCGACDGPLRQDEDVLDTWFSSALWPFATLGWPEQTDALRAFYPTDVVVTAREIIFLWVARMIMMGLEFAGDVPFSDVYVHAVIQAPDGRRMSKSLGTGIDPLEEIDRTGADAVRFGMLAMSSTQDVRYSAEKIEQGERLANKLFNAARFVILGIGERGGEAAPRPSAIEDRWILSRLGRFEQEVAERIAAYDFPRLALALYDFIYGELCDWYIELVKPRLGEPDLDATLRHVLRRTLLLAHPVMPFVTEELWRYVREDGDGLLAGATRGPAEPRLDDEAEAALSRVMAATQAIRNWREQVAVKPGVTLAARVEAAGYEGEVAPLLARIARLQLDGDGEAVAHVAIPGGAVAILEGVDLGAHAERQERERTRLLGEIERLRGKLANDAFVKNAPPEVVERERAKLAVLEAELEDLR
ncbi:MAG TPA: valine--tRNA ligase [Solirubrobacteraceae bacterium]|nr:valine--tRNA ligase [Solirubrobacteraceae bacterium]